MGQGPASRACCCGSGAGVPAAFVCPACGQPGRSVSIGTLRALLDPRWGDAVTEGPWRFCDRPACEVVYFGAEAAPVFRKNQLTVRVGIKETAPPHPLCYCFGHSEESLRAEWQATGRLDSVEALRAAVKAGRCQCDVMNPSGACCLGEVLKAAQALRGAAAAP